MEIVIALVCITVVALALVLAARRRKPAKYRCIPEDAPHEGTWLIWPHNYADFDYYQTPDNATSYRDSLENIWIAVAKALHTGETVHIVAYNEEERRHIENALLAADVDMSRIDFFIYATNDVWVRDTGPIFVRDETSGKLVIANFKFDGWGNKQAHDKDDGLAQAVADAYGLDIVQIPELALEGGAIELDGAGTLLAAKSSVASPNRNPGKTLKKVEAILRKYLGVTNFIWIEGSLNEDITDAHIDGTARFINDHQIFICNEAEYKTLYEHDPDESDWAVFQNAKNAAGQAYELVHLPLTQSTVKAYGVDLDNYGSYTNYYIGNEVVLVPQYGDPSDHDALEIIGRHYPGRTVVGIDCNNLIYYGGMIHCVTQQQPE